MDIIFRIAEIPEETIHIYFKRPQEENNVNTSRNELSIFFYSPRTEKPENKYTNYYWISLQDRTSLLDMIYGLLETIYYELRNEKQMHIHFGWPMSSWLDRISIGIMTYRLIRLPKKFPDFHFHLEYNPIK